MTSPTSYLSASEAGTLIAASLIAADALRVAWEAAGDEDKDAALTRATETIDACLWRGTVAEGDQPLNWPRIDRRGELIHPDLDEPATPQVAGLPRLVRLACALQAAWLLARAGDIDPLAVVEEAAARGVSNASGGGQSMTIDAAHARSPWARLHPRAQTLLTPLRAAGGSAS